MQTKFWTLVAGSALLLAGCVSDRDELLRSTNASVRNLERNMSSTVTQLNATAADLATQVDANQQETRRLQGMIQELQSKTNRLDTKVDQLSKTFYKANNMTGGASDLGVPADVEPGQVVAPGDPGAMPTAPAGPAETAATPPTAPPPVTPPAETPAPTKVAEAKPAAAADTDAARAEYEAAQKAFQAKNYSAALPMFDAILSKYPKSDVTPRAQFMKAFCLNGMAKYEDAAAEFGKFRKSYPDDQYVPRAMHNEATAYVNAGQKEKGIKLYKEVVDNYPMTSEAASAKARLQKLQGQ